MDNEVEIGPLVTDASASDPSGDDENSAAGIAGLVKIEATALSGRSSRWSRLKQTARIRLKRLVGIGTSSAAGERDPESDAGQQSRTRSSNRRRWLRPIRYVKARPRLAGLLAFCVMLTAIAVIRSRISRTGTDTVKRSTPLVFDDIEVHPPASGHRRAASIAELPEAGTIGKQKLGATTGLSSSARAHTFEGTGGQAVRGTRQPSPSFQPDNSRPAVPRSAWLRGTIEEIPHPSSGIRRIGHIQPSRWTMLPSPR